MEQMHHRREGYPFGSLVDFAADPIGYPIFSFSPLAIHTRNLLADPRCTHLWYRNGLINNICQNINQDLLNNGELSSIFGCRT